MKGGSEGGREEWRKGGREGEKKTKTEEMDLFIE